MEIVGTWNGDYILAPFEGESVECRIYTPTELESFLKNGRWRSVARVEAKITGGDFEGMKGTIIDCVGSHDIDAPGIFYQVEIEGYGRTLIHRVDVEY